KPEVVKQRVEFPANGTRFEYQLKTAHGLATPFRMFISDHIQSIASGKSSLASPGGVTGILDRPDSEHRFLCDWKKGDAWSLALSARKSGGLRDVTLAINGPADKEGKRKEVARNEDLPGPQDAGLEFPVPADGVYEIVVSDAMGAGGSAAATYWLDVQR